MAGMHNLTYYEVHRYIHSHKQKMLGKDDKNALKKGRLMVVVQYWLTALSILCLCPMDIYHHLYGYLPPPPPPLPQPTPWDRKVNDFKLKTFDKVSILYPGSLGTVSGQFWGPRGEKIIEENIGSVQNLRRLLGIRWQAQLKTYEENHWSWGENPTVV